MGLIVSKILAGEIEGEDRVVFIAGDTMAYAEFADVVERVTGRVVGREVWDIEALKEALERNKKEGEDVSLERYRYVFAGDGVAWNVEDTDSFRHGVRMMGVEEWMRKNAKSLFLS